MILESIVTTVGVDGRVNVAPMGPVLTNPAAMSAHVGDPGFILRPFEGSTTLKNLLATRRATIHVSDDAELFAHAAIGEIHDVESRVALTPDLHFAVLHQCHRWFQVAIESIVDSPPRYEMTCGIRATSIANPFFGFNRAKHAVIEAAILATRVHLMEPKEIRSQLAALKVPVDKTSGPAERAAYDLLTRTIEQRITENRGGR
ncbi:MAG: DUF447 domain-containing protein [Planctomycetota bacterium]